MLKLDTEIGHELPNTNIIIIYSGKKTDAPEGPSKGFLMCHLKNMRADGGRAHSG
mgnify:FL=1